MTFERKVNHYKIIKIYSLCQAERSREPSATMHQGFDSAQHDTRKP